MSIIDDSSLFKKMTRYDGAFLLLTFQKVRNRFAHEVTNISFETESRCFNNQKKYSFQIMGR